MEQELINASNMLKFAEDRVINAFDRVKETCKHRKQEETIGFEGCEWFKCENKKHPFIGSIYPFCTAKNCIRIVNQDV